MARLNCVVRGNGKGYALIDLDQDAVDPKKALLLVKLDDGTSIHGEIVESMGSVDTDSKLVLVFPLLDKPLTLFLMKREEETILFEKRFTPFSLKWKSRINYRIKQNEAHLIRDAEQKCYLTHRSIDIDAIIEDEGADVVRCALTVPGEYDVCPNIKVYDFDLHPLSIEPIPMGTPSRVMRKGISIPITEMSFSLRFPKSAAGHIIISEDPEEWKSSFVGIDRIVRDDYVVGSKQVFLNAQEDTEYGKWIEYAHLSDKALMMQSFAQFDEPIFVSIVTPVFNTSASHLIEMIESVLAQSYSNWEHILVNASPDNEEVCNILNSYAERDSRIVPVCLDGNLGIAQNTAKGIQVSQGDYVAFLDHDDILEPNALFEYVSVLNEDSSIDVVYCDEDKIKDGKRFDPYFKPDFSLFLLREINYVCHFLMVRKKLLEEIDYGDSVYDGAQDHNLILRCAEKTDRIHHIPKILYLWRVSEASTASKTDAKPYADAAGKLAIQRHLERLGIHADVVGTDDICRYHVRYSVEGDPLVSILIPNKDNANILMKCVSSILKKSTYGNFELIVIENNSEEVETRQVYEELQALDKRVKVIEWPGEFNYSAINNYGVEHAQGEYLLFLNNDTEVISKDWLETMLGICQQPEVGGVGVKLLYPDMLIQHAGVYVQGDGPGHLALNLPRHARGYFNTVRTTRELSAVTAACLMVDRAVFEEVDGFDPEYAVAFNDVDLCMKIRGAGRKIIYSPLVEVIHYESISRGYEKTAAQMLRFNKELGLLKYKWTNQFVQGDPYMNVNLHLNSGYYALPTLKEP